MLKRFSPGFSERRSYMKNALNATFVPCRVEKICAPARLSACGKPVRNRDVLRTLRFASALGVLIAAPKVGKRNARRLEPPSKQVLRRGGACPPLTCRQAWRSIALFGKD